VFEVERRGSLKAVHEVGDEDEDNEGLYAQCE
jgi:hypothetical protein